MLKRITINFSLILLLSLGVFAQGKTLFCAKSCVVGFASSCQKAKQVVGHKTISNVGRGLKFYITTKGDELFIASNYRPNGQPYPFKVTSNEDLPLETLIKFLLFQDTKSSIDFTRPQELAYMTRAMRLRAFAEPTFIVDQKVFSHPVYKNLEFPTPFVKVRGSDGISRSIERIQSSEGGFRNILRLDTDSKSPLNNVYVPIEHVKPVEFLKRMEQTAFRKDDIALLSLVRNTATEAKIASSIKAENRIAFDLLSHAELEKVLTQNQQRKIFVLGHMEGDSFVTLAANNRELFKIQIAELQRIAQKAKVSIFALGCNSAGVDDVGIPHTFNTIDAVQNLASAINGSNNYKDFVGRLASGDLHLVVDDSITFGANRVVTFRVLSGKNLAAAVVVGVLVIAQSTGSEDEDKRKKRRRQNLK